jgi:3-hydroxyisobutyrate dehydrogenase-like beta-hydroxyacid dehydrogenase
MESRIALIGFGEAAAAFVGAMPETARPFRAYDLKTDNAATRSAKLADYARHGTAAAATSAEALDGAGLVLSLVTADQALLAAQAGAASLAPGALWCDMNSVAPDTKRGAAAAVEQAGGRYVDVAVLAPVYPQRLAVPLLLSGPHAEAGAMQLRALGFTNVSIIAGEVGKASAIKMIRSVMVKGLEALTAEWILAAEAAGVRDEAVAALNASWPGTDWAAKADYNLERMLVHGLRRAAEMEEAVKTLDALGTGSAMTCGTVARQRALGELGLTAPDTLDAKLALLLGHDESKKDAA